MGSESRRATEIVTIRVTPEEHERIVLAGAARGVGPSTFARLALTDALGLPTRKTPRKVVALDRVIREALGELGRIGNNANQIARIANRSGEAVSIAAAAALRAEVASLTKAVMDLR